MIKQPSLEFFQLESKSWSALFYPSGLKVLEDVSMVTEKDKVSLIVERDHSAPFELWLLWKQRSKHATQRMPQSGIEVVQDELREMIARIRRALDLLAILDAGDAVER